MLILSLGVAGCHWPGASRYQGAGTLELTEHGVGARVAGRLTTLTVDEGQAVQAGQLLGTLERHAQAQRDHERLAALLAQGGATQQAVEQAALEVEDQTIVSPVDGVVLVKVHEVGEVVSAAAPVVVIGDRAHLWVRLFVPEGVISRVRQDQPAAIRFDGIQRSFQGHVSFIAPKAEFTPRNVQTSEERVTQVFAIKVTLDETEPWLRPGVAAEVTLDLAGVR